MSQVIVNSNVQQVDLLRVQLQLSEFCFLHVLQYCLGATILTMTIFKKKCMLEYGIQTSCGCLRCEVISL